MREYGEDNVTRAQLCIPLCAHPSAVRMGRGSTMTQPRIEEAFAPRKSARRDECVGWCEEERFNNSVPNWRASTSHSDLHT